MGCGFVIHILERRFAFGAASGDRFGMSPVAAILVTISQRVWVSALHLGRVASCPGICRSNRHPYFRLRFAPNGLVLAFCSCSSSAGGSVLVSISILGTYVCTMFMLHVYRFFASMFCFHRLHLRSSGRRWYLFRI